MKLFQFFIKRMFFQTLALVVQGPMITLQSVPPLQNKSISAISATFSHIFGHQESTSLSTTEKLNFLIILRRHPSTLEM